MDEIKFGTDGWRARMDQTYTPANVARVAHAYAQYVCAQEGQRRGIVVGYDNRQDSENFAEQVSEILATYGIRVWLSDAACPTPAVSSYIVDQGAFGGVMITASHNPAQFNGFKIKDHYGKSADPEVTAWVENHIDVVGAIHELPPRPTVVTTSMIGPYTKRLKKSVDLDLIAKQPINILVNCLYGSGGGVMTRLFSELSETKSIRITEMNAQRDITFGGINPEPLDYNVRDMQKIMQDQHYDLGLVFDGDADRIGAMMPDGTFLSSQDIYVLLLWHLTRHKKLSGRVVKSFNITDRIDRLAQLTRCPVELTAIGFKHIAPFLLKKDTLIGGEESGGFAMQGYIPERDGIFCGLVLLELLAHSQQSITEIMAEIAQELGSCAYDRYDAHITSNESKDAIVAQVENPSAMEFAGLAIKAIESLDGIKYRFGDGHWILFRKSGTEPLLRIYAEGPDAHAVASLLGAAKALLV